MMKINVKEILGEAGIKINGNNPWDIKASKNPLKQLELQKRINKEGVFGLGDSYVDGEWDCDSLDQFFDKVIKLNVVRHFSDHPTEIECYEKERDINLQEGDMSKENIKRHYDHFPEEIFVAMLGSTMAYSCGYWKDAKTLDEAQEAKLDLICRKLGLSKGMKVLDIGCGWGSFVKFAAEKYGVEAFGITLSENQVDYVNRTKGDLPVEVKLMDYKKLKGSGMKFDRVVSVGMFEHVGHKNFRTYMEAVDDVLEDGGMFLLHNFGGLYDTPSTKQPETRWIERHIFPGMELPSLSQLISASQGLFNVHDVHNFGRYYDPTLMAWAEKFNKAWPELQPKLFEKYGEDYEGEKFRRFWNFYLMKSAGGFRSGKFQLWQTVFSKGYIGKVYQAVR